MTINIGETVFSGTGRFCRMGAAVVLLAIAGCSSTNIEGATPVAATDGPKNTGTYPNLNIPPQVAAEQFTEAEKNAKLAQLKADEQAQASKGGAVKAADPALNTLARKHGAEALKQIEAKCDPALDPTCK
ncbi:MAG: hypothetical protein EOR30_32970 [Mesorhizobium sp.]|uniref:hypothetical protein n=1 Tax=unclassified Mesorhizobium TaxID=325217 RepID=UPI000FCB9AD1|nr:MULTISPECIES: hypothetical protein [unclassified Mesorhizobium]RUV67272.1 hypothetical protein EOA78_30890 [Mesorhizobium sp. M5C.F.Cr.IN.023.01.1.1]RWF85448.1 MAG: hypothetical protein EOQ36_22540 [Mesorhizobium sp.]RWF93473.1 MAG: hypothetical protein EOQ45_17045 [Mesorhizobium sp.]RWI34616.1 MAG: hypothetical protein EOR14_30445 [Mesorhizobium sp.]RWI45649.1 MAG: hypothetical protein EOR15_22035 [Mesorhizobium sp.]